MCPIPKLLPASLCNCNAMGRVALALGTPRWFINICDNIVLNKVHYYLSGPVLIPNCVNNCTQFSLKFNHSCISDDGIFLYISAAVELHVQEFANYQLLYCFFC